MSISSNERAARVEKRISEAYAAAENGHGWTQLGHLWGTTNASALMWCKPRLPEAVWKKIGQNGQLGRNSTRGRRIYYHAKPETKTVTRTHREPNHFCARVRYSAGQLTRCNADTNGKTYCKACAHELATQHCGSNYRNYALIGRVSG